MAFLQLSGDGRPVESEGIGIDALVGEYFAFLPPLGTQQVGGALRRNPVDGLVRHYVRVGH